MLAPRPTWFGRGVGTSTQTCTTRYDIRYYGRMTTTTRREELDALYDGRTPLERMLLSEVASRHRLGHKLWTIETDQATTKVIKRLVKDDLLVSIGGTIEKTDRVRLTAYGREMLMLPDYVPPIAACPTPCDYNCEAICHEDHQNWGRKEHLREKCPAYVYLENQEKMWR